ncbi:hypothetical protein H4Q26_014245 [Puccinia striiformis f. sp. tritici PST-130]|nr:hypothetical protein H4Q26_014245 [Puccinia striiformis f. sp. tritici PST-130]
MATTTGSTNRSAFETANSLKKQLVSSISASNDKEIKECLERIKKEIVPSEELIRATKIGISVGPSLSSSQHSNLKSPKPDPSISKLPTTSPGVKATNYRPIPSPASTTSTANDEKVRNGSLKAVFDALIFDSDAPADLIYDRAIAIELEVDKKNDSTGYKNKMRSLIFNLRDKNNPGLRESVVSGEISASKLCVMGPQDMASEERKSQDRKLAEENLFKARGAGPQQAETDAFRCARCADEPMTVRLPFFLHLLRSM